MDVTRIDAARPYDAPGHHGMTALRLQGHAASGATSAWIGLSHFLPGGGANTSASAVERMYVVVEGEITVLVGDTAVTLGPLDSCHIPPGETRAVENRTNRPASMLVVMPYSARGDR
jgi:mannose-6-phosphate isomerase-like protein (cupin superfamily)